MKAKITVEFFTDEGKLLSESTQELLGLGTHPKTGKLQGLQVSDYQKVNQVIDQSFLKAQSQRAFF